MNRNEWAFVIAAASAVVIGGVWLARRAAAANGVPARRFAPLGFSWNAQRGQYTRVNARGQVEVYAQDVYL